MKIDIAPHQVGDSVTFGYVWFVFPDGTEEPIYVPANDPHNTHNGNVRFSKDANEYGEAGLTRLGLEVFNALNPVTATETFEVWSDNPSKRIRVQVANNWSAVTSEQLDSYLALAKLELQQVFGDVTFGEREPIR